jgi:hypothetical protein
VVEHRKKLLGIGKYLGLNYFGESHALISISVNVINLVGSSFIGRAKPVLN